jgi:hypothetical protein
VLTDDDDGDDDDDEYEETMWPLARGSYRVTGSEARGQRSFGENIGSVLWVRQMARAAAASDADDLYVDEDLAGGSRRQPHAKSNRRDPRAAAEGTSRAAPKVPTVAQRTRLMPVNAVTEAPAAFGVTAEGVNELELLALLHQVSPTRRMQLLSALDSTEVDLASLAMTSKEVAALAYVRADRNISENPSAHQQQRGANEKSVSLENNEFRQFKPSPSKITSGSSSKKVELEEVHEMVVDESGGNVEPNFMLGSEKDGSSRKQSLMRQELSETPQGKRDCPKTLTQCKENLPIKSSSKDLVTINEGTNINIDGGVKLEKKADAGAVAFRALLAISRLKKTLRRKRIQKDEKLKTFNEAQPHNGDVAAGDAAALITDARSIHSSKRVEYLSLCANINRANG